MNPALLAPAGTTMVLGTCAQFTLSESDTATPPIGARDPRVMVPVEDCPARIVAGFNVREAIGGGRTVSVWERVTPYIPETVTGVEVPTVPVATVNVVEVVPAATVTLDGTVAAVVLLLVNVTTAPPLGAPPLRVTVPIDDDPPATLFGLSVSEERVGGFIVSVPVRVVP